MVYFISNTESSLKKILNKNDLIIVDDYILKNYTHLNILKKKNKILSVNSNEKSKSFNNLNSIIDNLIKNNFKKNNKIIAIGGGVIQDIACFVSSILYRGVDWIFFPTTLIAQADSCIGSKSSINYKNFKNQIGTFYPPRKIYININFLNTLKKKHFYSGLGEMSHYFIIGGYDSFVNFSKFIKNINNFNKNDLKKLIYQSLEIKKKYIEKDEFDKDIRQILNYGHSFGHAIESSTNYKIPHGISVAIGIDLINYISVKKNILNVTVRNEIRNSLLQIWNIKKFAKININQMFKSLAQDKTNINNRINVVMLKKYGFFIRKKIHINNNLIKIVSKYFHREYIN